jgi:hypothetical protein
MTLYIWHIVRLLNCRYDIRFVGKVKGFEAVLSGNVSDGRFVKKLDGGGWA